MNNDDLPALLAAEVRQAATIHGLSADGAAELETLLGLAVVGEVAGRHGLDLPNAAFVVLTHAARTTRGSEGKRSVRRADVAMAALGVDDYAGMPGKHARLSALGSVAQVELNTLRSYWRVVAVQIGERLATLRADEVVLAEDSPGAGQWDYVTVRAEARYEMVRRRPSRCVVVRELKAVRRPLVEFSFPFHYPKDIREGVVVPTGLFNCDVAGTSLGGLGEQNTVLTLPHTPIGQTVRFGYEITIRSEVDDLPFLRHRGLVPGGGFLLEVQFDTQTPKEIWSFANKQLQYDPTREVDESRRVALSSFGYGRATFDRERTGRALGVAWRW